VNGSWCDRGFRDGELSLYFGIFAARRIFTLLRYLLAVRIGAVIRGVLGAGLVLNLMT